MSTVGGVGGAQPVQASFRRWMGAMWLYTLLRIALFLVLWGIVVLLGVGGLLSALLAALLSVPLGFVLLARPRARFAAQIEARIEAQRAARADLDKELDPDNENEGGSATSTP